MTGLTSFVRRNVPLRDNDRLDQVAALLACGDDELAVHAREHLTVLYQAVRAVLGSHTADASGACSGCMPGRRWWGRPVRHPCSVRRRTLWTLANTPPGTQAAPVRWGARR